MLANEIALTESFRDNVNYNLYGKKAEPNPEKCAWHITRNLPTDDLEVGTRIMEATAAQSKAEECCYHFSLDWHADEADYLMKDNAIEAADRLLKKLKLENNQAMYFWHTDADHPHMHIVVNRAHESKDGVVRSHDMWKSKEKLEKAVYELAQEMGFEQVQGRHNSKDFEPDREKGAPQTKEERVHTNDLKAWVKEDIQGVKDKFRASLHDAYNWTELHESLATQGLEIRSKGQGFIITDGTHFTQFSKLGKDFRGAGKRALESKFGITFDEHKELMRNQELTNAEKLAEWAEEAEKHHERQVEATLDPKVYELMQAVERAEDFEKRQIVQRSASTVLWTQDKIRYQEKLLDRAKGILDNHNTKFKEMLVEIYKDPDEAEKAVRELYSQNQLQEAVKTSGVKKERWKVIIDRLKGKQRDVAKKLGKKNSRTRKRADKFERSLFYRLQKIREAENRITERRRQVVQAKFDYRAKKKEHKQKLAQRDQLQNLKELAARDITQRMIFTADIPWREKKKLLTQWDRANGKPAEQELDKSQDKDRDQDLER